MPCDATGTVVGWTTDRQSDPGSPAPARPPRRWASTSAIRVSGWACPSRDPARWHVSGSRLGAVAIDWIGCQLIAYGLITGGNLTAAGNWTLWLFLALSVLTIGTVGFTPGKRILGLRVISENGGRLGVFRVLLRTLLLALVIPALIWDRDGRGLHDRLARAVQVRI